MLRRRQVTVLLSATVVLAGCAASVKYAPRVAGFQPGYQDERLGESTFKVVIGEAWPKDWHDLEKFAMYRAAEITQGQGRRYFAVLNASSLTSNFLLPATTTLRTQGTVTSVGGTAFVNATSTATVAGGGVISGGWYTLEFRVISDAEVPATGRVVDSEQVKQDLRFFIDARR